MQEPAGLLAEAKMSSNARGNTTLKDLTSSAMKDAELKET